MVQLKINIAVFGCVILLASCYANKYVYTPSTANLLTPTKKGNVQVAVNYSSAASSFNGLREGQHSNGLDLQTAAAVSNKIAVKADYYTKKENSYFKKIDSSTLENYVSYKKSGFEISGGFYNISKNNNKTNLQLFAGFGTGKLFLNETKRENLPVNYYHQMQYNKFYLQPSLSINDPNFSIGVATRFSLVFYKNIETNIPYIKEESLGYIDSKPSFFGDLIVHSQFGFKGLNIFKFQIQAGIYKLFTQDFAARNSLLDIKYHFNNKWIALGVITDMSKIF